MKYLVTKEIRLEMFQTFLEQIKNAALKQNNMKTICQDIINLSSQNKGTLVGLTFARINFRGFRRYFLHL